LITKSPQAIEIAPLDAVEITVEPWTWPFAQARRADMDRHFAARQRESMTWLMRSDVGAADSPSKITLIGELHPPLS
jgi:hypothetical protein